jgi:hypothetical protein
MLYPPTGARTILDMRWQVAVTLLDVGLALVERSVSTSSYSGKGRDFPIFL